MKQKFRVESLNGDYKVANNFVRNCVGGDANLVDVSENQMLWEVDGKFFFSHLEMKFRTRVKNKC